MDVDDIPPGGDFAAQIETKVASCDAVVVVIGKQWLTTRNDKGQLRLTDANDYVGLEVSLALQRSVLVIPVLVGGAQMPRAEELRADLRALATRNALTLNDQEFQRDADVLVQALEKIPAIQKTGTEKSSDARMALRRKLFRRLLWKAPLIFLLVSFAVWWQWRKENDEASKHERSSPAAAAIVGSWSGAVRYSWGDRYSEQFLFQPEGAKLFGTASFLGVKRAIEDGRIEGENFSFVVRFQEDTGGTIIDHKNYYWGKVAGNEIRLRMQDDRGNPALEWTLARQ